MDARASEVARAAGHRVYEGRFEEAALPPAYFDLVVMAHVLEHLPRPRLALEKLARLLKPGGVALIRTPAHDSLAARLFGPDWFPLEAPRHLTIFSARALRRECERAGLCVTRITRRQDPRYLLSSVKRAWLSLLGPRRPRRVECAATRHILLGLPPARVIQWLGLGDEITVTCRRAVGDADVPLTSPRPAK